MSNEEAIAYAQRGRGERKRPASGWASLTPTERDVVKLVSEGLANKDIATRLFVSPRTVETHLTHVYTKLGTQLARPACPRGGPSHLTILPRATTFVRNYAACRVQTRSLAVVGVTLERR